MLRKLYDWVLNWAYTPYGSIALIILSFSEATFFPIPPDVLLIALVLGSHKKAFKFALLCSIASVLGAIMGYGIGNYLWWDGSKYSYIANFFFNNIPGLTEDLFLKMQSYYEQFGFFIIFTAGFTPIPFKIITISSGAFNIPIPLFIIASAISRTARFFLVSYLIWKFGKNIKIFIDNYFNFLSIALIVILFGSYIVYSFSKRKAVYCMYIVLYLYCFSSFVFLFFSYVLVNMKKIIRMLNEWNTFDCTNRKMFILFYIP